MVIRWESAGKGIDDQSRRRLHAILNVALHSSLELEVHGAKPSVRAKIHEIADEDDGRLVHVTSGSVLHIFSKMASAVLALAHLRRYHRQVYDVLGMHMCARRAEMIVERGLCGTCAMRPCTAEFTLLVDEDDLRCSCGTPIGWKERTMKLCSPRCKMLYFPMVFRGNYNGDPVYTMGIHTECDGCGKNVIDDLEFRGPPNAKATARRGVIRL